MQHGIILVNKLLRCIPCKSFKISDKVHLIEIFVSVSDVGQFGIFGVKKLLQGVLEAIQQAVSSVSRMLSLAVISGASISLS